MKFQNKQNLLIKHSAAVHTASKLSAVERKISNILLLNAYPNLLANTRFHIRVDQLLKTLGWKKGSNLNQDLKSNFDKLIDIKLHWNILSKDRKRKWGTSTWLSYYEIRDGIIEYSYSDKIRNLLFRPNIYTVLNLDYQKVLKSRHTIALWELCNEQLDSNKSQELQTEYIAILKLRELLGAESEGYSIYKDFNKHVLKPAVKEINEKTDLKIEQLVKKTGRKVVATAFKIERQLPSQSQQLEMLENTPDMFSLVTKQMELENIVGKGAKLGLKEEQINKFLREYNINEVSEVFDILLTKIKQNNKIKNISGYIWTLLDRGVIESPTFEEVHSNLLQLETQQKHEKEDEIKQQIIQIIQEEQDEVRKKVLITCAEIIDSHHFIKMAETMRVVSYEQNLEEILLCVFMDYKCIITKKHKLERALEEKFTVENKKTFIRIETDK